jgi:anti-sigma regulatory factor (Ser/Thr protein kinase)
MVPGRPEVVPALRALVGSLLPHHHALEDIRLMATEVITNAIRHTRSGEPNGTLTVTVLDLGYAARVEVIDQGGIKGRPHLRDDTKRDSEDGYGLQLVAALAATWEAVTWCEGSKTWFEI